MIREFEATKQKKDELHRLPGKNEYLLEQAGIEAQLADAERRAAEAVAKAARAKLKAAKAKSLLKQHA